MNTPIKRLSSPLRIAFLLRDAGEGGAERSSLRLANGLARKGADVTLFLLRSRGPLLNSIDPAVRTVDLRGAFLRLLIELRARPVDFLLPVYTSMRTLLAKRVLGGPFRVVLSQRNMFTMDRGPVQTRLRFLRCRLLYPLASACVCISRGVADEMRALRLLPQGRIHTIYNPVVTEALLEQARAPLPHPWMAPGEPPEMDIHKRTKSTPQQREKIYLKHHKEHVRVALLAEECLSPVRRSISFWPEAANMASLFAVAVTHVSAVCSGV